jgi:hypothetical protein
MSDQSPADPAATRKPKTAEQRNAELRRALQRQARRKLKGHEQAALERAAYMMTLAEVAAYNPKSTSEDVVRLDNAARRARLDFERIVGITERKPKPQRSMADLEAEIRAHG